MKKQVILGLALGIITLLIISNKTIAQQKPQDANTCRQCHSDAKKMKELGYPELAMAREDVEKQTGMPATCEMCHQGNPNDNTVEGAHKGILGLSVVMKKGATFLLNLRCFHAWAAAGTRYVMQVLWKGEGEMDS